MSKKAIIAVVVAAIVVVAVIIGIQQATNSSSSGGSSASFLAAYQKDLPNVEAMLKGIPQTDQTLGRADATYKITEYMDYKCPICGAASKQLVPQIIQDYVRTGKANITLSPVHVIPGNQSVSAALAGFAAAPQNKMWQFTELILRNQGSNEDAPYLTSAVLTDAATTAGLDVATWNQVQQEPQVADQFVTSLNDWGSQTSSAGLEEATPTFVITGPKGSTILQGLVPVSDFQRAFAAVS